MRWQDLNRVSYRYANQENNPMERREGKVLRQNVIVKSKIMGKTYCTGLRRRKYRKVKVRAASAGVA